MCTSGATASRVRICNLATAASESFMKCKFLDVEDTKFPKLDRDIKQNLARDVKGSDVAAANMQTLLMDAAAPLVFIVEEAQRAH